MNIINFIIDLGIIQGSLEQLKLLTDFIIDNFNNIDYNIIKLVLKNIAKFLNLTTETLSFIAQIITPFIDFFIEKLPDLIEILGLNETNETDEPAKNAQNAQIITDFIQILISPQKLSKEFITTVFNLLIKFLQELFSDSINQIEFYLKKLINSINPEYFQNILQSIKDIFLPNIQDNTKKNDILGILLGIIISFIGEENFKLIQDQLGSIFENIKNNIQKLKSILIPIIEKLSKSITDFKDLISNLICILKGFVETIIDFIETLQLIFEIIDKAVNFDSLSSFLQSLFKIFQEYFFSPELLKEILNSVMDFIARIISKIPIDEFFNKIKEIFEPLLDNFGIKKVDNDDDVEKLIKDIIGKIFKNLKTISDAIFSISISVLQIIITFFNISVGVIDKILTFVTPYLIPLIQGIKQIINTITNVLKSILTFLKAIYKSFDAIVESLDTLFDKIEDYKNYDQLKADSTFKNVTDNINTSLNNNPTSNNQTANKDIFNIILELIK
jgi:phage-related protein